MTKLIEMTLHNAYGLDCLVYKPPHKTATKHNVCAQISIVSQEPVLFAETILYNICFGMPKGTESVSREQVRALTTQAWLRHVHDSSSDWPDPVCMGQPSA